MFWIKCGNIEPKVDIICAKLIGATPPWVHIYLTFYMPWYDALKIFLIPSFNFVNSIPLNICFIVIHLLNEEQLNFWKVLIIQAVTVSVSKTEFSKATMCYFWLLCSTGLYALKPQYGVRETLDITAWRYNEGFVHGIRAIVKEHVCVRLQCVCIGPSALFLPLFPVHCHKSC